MAKKETAAEAGMVNVRVLSDCDLGKANDVVQLDASLVESYERGGNVDATPEAVAYAMTLPQNQPELAPEQ